MEEKIFIDQNELAKRWIRSPRTLENWRTKGTGPKYIKIGGKVLYRLKDIEEIEKNSVVMGE
jgi:hypothetical protein